MEKGSVALDTIVSVTLTKSRSISLDAVGDIQFPTYSMEHDIIPESLLNLAAITTAALVSCEEMERHHPPLDEALLKKVAFLACPEEVDSIKAIADVAVLDCKEWKSGENFVSRNAVKDIRQVGFMVTAVVANSYVSFTFEK